MSFLKTNNYLGQSHTQFSHARPQKIGVLITNLGTPDEPTYFALRRYLREFLSDPRVIEYNKAVWWVILNFIILTFRPFRSAANYRTVWTKEGSPLLLITKDQQKKLGEYLAERFPGQFEVALGMRYGNPSIKSGVEELLRKNVDRLLVIPLYPQYAAATTGSTFDAVADVLKTVRSVPEFQFLTRYHDEPAFIEALTDSIKKVWDRNGRPDKLIFSYHGIPKRYFLNGDPYHCHCRKTSRLVAEKLGLKSEEYLTCFQSLFGKEEWLKPYTINTVEELAKEGLKKLDVICPGFSADCLETIEEIDGENRHAFLENGGEQFRYIPALNAEDGFISFLGEFTERHCRNWINSSRETKEAIALRERLAERL